jgi:D-tyrosyl-tRNA(Tyr) deacylase
MRLLIQRVRRARVECADGVLGEIGAGFLVLAGFSVADTAPAGLLSRPEAMDGILDKLLGLRIFPDADGKMNIDIAAFGGGILLVPQFTLYADCRKGRRPSFHLAAEPAPAEAAFARLLEATRRRLPGRTGAGRFGADMDVHLCNWGPVTIMLDSDTLSGARRD